MLRVKRSHLIILAVIAALAVVSACVSYTRNRRPAFEVVAAERRDLVRTVTITGNVEPAAEVVLAFEVAGRIARATEDVGAVVAAGQEIVALDQTSILAELAQSRASLATEQAKLAELRAGTRPEELLVTETDVENAQRALVNAETNLANVRVKADLDLADDYDDVPTTLRDAYTKTDDAVRKQIDGVFMNAATENPKLTFSSSDYQAAIDAESQRRSIEFELVQWSNELAALSADQSGRDAALTAAERRLDATRVFLERLSAAVNGAMNISATTVSTYKTNINTARTNINTARTNISTLEQSIAVQRATNQSAITAAESDVTVKRNALSTAEVKLALARAGSTHEQIRAQEARVAAASASVQQIEARLTKTVIRAPFAGVITKQDAKIGATAIAGTPLITLMSASGFTVETNVPEVDLADLVVGSDANVTLDAYGSELVFSAAIVSIDPAAVTIDGVPTYRTKFSFKQRDARIRVGMTANVAVVTGRRSGVVAIPQRAVLARDGDSYVRVPRNGQPIEIPVTIGLRSSDGYVEIIEGLRAGDSVIRSVKK